MLLAGSAQNTLSIGTWTLPGTAGAFVASISSDGCPGWSTRVSGSPSPTAWDVTTDLSGGTIAVLSASGNITFLPGNSMWNISPTLSTQTLVVWLSPTGALLRVTELGANQEDEPAAVATTPNTVCVLGRRSSTPSTLAITHWQLWSDGGVAWSGEATGGVGVGDFPRDVVGLPDDTCVFASQYGATPTGIVPSTGYIGTGAFAVTRFAPDGGRLSNGWFRPSANGSAALALTPGDGVLLAMTGSGLVSIGGTSETLTRSAGYLVRPDLEDGGLRSLSRSDEVGLANATIAAVPGEVWLGFSQSGDAGSLGWGGLPLPRSGAFTSAVLVRSNMGVVTGLTTAAVVADGGGLATGRFLTGVALSPGVVWAGGNYTRAVEVGGVLLSSPNSNNVFYVAPFSR